MGQTSSEIRGEIEDKKMAIGLKLDTLEERIHSARDQAKNLFNLEHHAQERPWMFVGIAAGAGFLLGLSRVRLPVAALAGIALKALPAGLVMKSLRDEDQA